MQLGLFFFIALGTSNIALINVLYLKKQTPVFLPGKSHGQRNLAGYSSRGHKESDATEHVAQAYNRIC